MFLIILLLLLFLLLNLPLKRSSQAGGGLSGEFCPRNNGRRFNAKLYRSSTSGGLVSREGSIVPEDFTRPLNGFLIRPKEEVKIVLPDYEMWLLSQRVAYLKPLDRANRLILDRGGRLTAQDVPAYYKPPPENSEQAFKKLLGPEVQVLPQPEYLGFLPYNFNIADEKQVSMNELNYINPTERLKAWELTHIKNNNIRE
jgi:hypothetical protein